MSVEGAGPHHGAEPGTASPEPTGNEDEVVPERRDVRGISDLTYRIITPYLSNPLLHRAVWIALVALTVVCVVAVPVRLSALPLMPIPLFAAAYYALRRARAAGEDNRALVVWSLTLLATFLLGFWLLSTAARWLT
ncbi:MAG TPA: hypothetical protein VJ870_14090 [Amycolatopsis sp.]|nr:hypothetical protein [Amycolatopsis sp.]